MILNLNVCIQENNWDLSRSLNSYFATKCEKLEAERTAEKEDGSAEAGPWSGGQDDYVNVEAALQSGVLTSAAPLTLVTWNIDQKNLKRRTRAVIETLTSVGADIVFLQEVIPETFSYLESKLTGYECIAAKQENYFVATLVRRGRVYVDKHKVVDFPTTRMYRHVLAVQVWSERLILK